MLKEIETMGRARVEHTSISSCIIVKTRLEDSFDTIPRPVKHVGNREYINGIR